MTVTRYKATRFWAVREAGSGALVCVCVYRKGAQEVARRLANALSCSAALPSAQDPFWDPRFAHLAEGAGTALRHPSRREGRRL